MLCVCIYMYICVRQRLRSLDNKVWCKFEQRDKWTVECSFACVKFTKDNPHLDSYSIQQFVCVCVGLCALKLTKG